jgi:hypothetical protein
MYKCTKCGKGVIVEGSEVIRACAEECKNEPIVAELSGTVYNKSNMSN